jgi:hypothetical protein
MFAGIQIEFILFALVLIGVAVFHRRTFEVAVAGAVVITGYRLLVTPFNLGFAVMLAVVGWRPHAPNKRGVSALKDTHSDDARSRGVVRVGRPNNEETGGSGWTRR